MQNGPVALVTGANQGIGLQIAKDLAAKGYKVILGSRNLERGQVAAASVGRDAHAVQIDVTDPASIENAAAHIRSAFGHLDILVNNAAISHTGDSKTPMADIMASGRADVVSIDEIRAVFETNVFGVIAVTQAMLPLLRKSAGPRIVNIGSGLGSLTLNSDPNFPYRGGFNMVYAASKTALNAVTLALAIELEPENIKVNVASPGYTATALNNFEGTDTVEQGSRTLVQVITDASATTGTFTGPDGPMPW
jgi:NAD(P)-dependent dehydrogenase (short-subunit alcohol dehydrogenase family)